MRFRDQAPTLNRAPQYNVAWSFGRAGFYTKLKGSPGVVDSAKFLDHAKDGPLPSLVMLWHNNPNDEHPPANVTTGMELIWQSVDAVAQSGGWEETVFMLTWDDWGGYDDHVATPVLEYTPDNVQLAYGPRIPLIMFGGYVKPGIDSRWCSHVSVPRTAIQLLNLPNLGVPRVDRDGGLADLVDIQATPNPPPPAFGSPVSMPPLPAPPRQPNPLPPFPPGAPAPVGAVLLRDGTTLPPPNDVPLPQQPNPPA